MSIEITTRGLDQLIERFRKMPAAVEEAEVLSINRGIRFAHTASSREIRDQVNLKASYLGSASTGGNDRLRITRYAKAGSMEAVLRGRERPTSLATYTVGSRRLGKRTRGRPVRVKVSAKGGAVSMPGAWLMHLRAGKVLDDDTFNDGLAIRLKPGQTINKRQLANSFGDFEFGEKRETPKSGRMYMLYGPSVAQVFDTVSQDVQEPVAEFVEREFIRQFERLSR